MHDVDEFGLLCDAPRAGGRFRLMRDAVPLLQRLSEEQKARVGYWIFDHNRRYRLFDEKPAPVGPPVLDSSWVVAHRDRQPSAGDRLLSFLRELIRQHDVLSTRNDALLGTVSISLIWVSGY